MQSNVNISPCHEDNRLVIRVWSSLLTGGSNVGHVSLEIPHDQYYFSLWPCAPKASKLNFLQNRTPLITTLERDMWLEGAPDLTDQDKWIPRAPESIICLYSLDKEAIKRAYESDTKYLKGWKLIVGTGIFVQDPTLANAESCASLCFKLLQAGRIDELLNPSQPSEFSSVITPDRLCQYVAEAKLNELKKHPKTQEFSKFEGEYIPDESVQEEQSSSICLTM
jgi:hypothetical protein